MSPLALPVFHQCRREFIIGGAAQLTRVYFWCATGDGENRATNGAAADPLRDERDDEDDHDPKDHSSRTGREYVVDQIRDVVHVVLA